MVYNGKAYFLFKNDFSQYGRLNEMLLARNAFGGKSVNFSNYSVEKVYFCIGKTDNFGFFYVEKTDKII